MTALPLLPALAQSGINTESFRSECLHLAERADAALLRVHSLLPRPAQGAEFAGWPARTGECLGDDPAVLCLRPREWLLLGERLAPGALFDRIEAAIDPSETAVYDQSDGLALFRLGGSAAPWLLAKHSALDFPAGVSGAAHCARTRLGHVAVVVRYRGRGSGEFDLVVDRSLARYLWELLTDSAPHAQELARSGRPRTAEGAA